MQMSLFAVLKACLVTCPHDVAAGGFTRQFVQRVLGSQCHEIS